MFDPLHDWSELSRLIKGRPVRIERVRLTDQNIAITGDFELPELARLAPEDQIFVAAFVRSHGSIKEMEQVFGVSYPTIKSRLNRIGAALTFIETDVAPDAAPPVGPELTSSRAEVLDRLARGEITADEAVAHLERL